MLQNTKGVGGKTIDKVLRTLDGMERRKRDDE